MDATESFASESQYDPMPEVVLKEYLGEIDRLIEDSHLEEAIGHCRHLLKQFPRHVDVYRLLGKALLEAEDYAGANDVFLRVLSADPEDFLAHAGIAIIRKQEGKLSEAAWHMERAFDAEPYNGAIREALQDIIGRRDGLPPESLSLTRSALARLYVRGELYSHAIQDLQQALVDEPDRIDLQLLLAEALWRDGQRIDAAERSRQILERLPYCIKANAIMAEVCLTTDRADEAQEYLKRVFELTLPTAAALQDDSAVAIAFATPGSPPLPDKIMAEAKGLGPETDEGVKAADWINDLDFGEELVIDDIEPTWLGGLQVKSGPDEVVAESDEEPLQDDFDLTTEAGETGDGTSWFSRSSDQLPGIGEVEQETDWEAWIGHESFDEGLEQPSEPDAVLLDNSDVEEDGMGTNDDLGKGAGDFPGAEDSQPSSADEPAEGEQNLDWLDALQEAAGDDEDVAHALEDDELPEWLRDGVTIEDMAPEELEWLDDRDEGQVGDAASASASDHDLPEWLRDELGDEETPGAEPGGDDLSWLDQIAAGEGMAMEEPPTLSWEDAEDITSDEDSFWESEDFEDDLVGASMPEVGGAMAGEQSANEGAFSDDDVPEDLDEAMAWLEQLAAQQGAPVEELPSLSPTPEASAAGEPPQDLDDAMDWLDELASMGEDESYDTVDTGQSEQTAELAFDADDDWLGELETDETTLSSEMEGADEEIELEAGIGRAEFEPQTVPPDDSLPEDGMEEDDFWDISETQDAAEEEVPEDLDEAMAWLEQLAAQQGAPIDELPSLKQSSADSPFDEISDMEEMEAEEAPVDEAMTWLDHLAAGDEVDFAELEGLEDVAPGDIDDLGEIPDDPELALAWLEGLANEGSVREDASAEAEGSIVQEEATPPVPHDVVAARAEAEAILLHEAEHGTDTESDAEMLEEIPDDPDEAMAWLEQLAARQGAPVEELPSLSQDAPSGYDAGVEDESWEMDDEDEAFEYEDLSEPSAETLSAETAAVESTMGAGQESDEVEDDAFSLDLELGDEDLEGDLPDWLSLDEDSEDAGIFEWDEPTPGTTDWLIADDEPREMGEEDAAHEATVAHEAESLEVGVETEAEPEPELEAEPSLPVAEDGDVVEEEMVPAPGQIVDDGEAMVTEPVVEEDADEPDEVWEAEPEVETSAGEEWEAEAEEAAADEVEPAAVGGLDDARSALEAGQHETALPVYQALIESGSDLSTVIADLEGASDALGNEPGFLQTLGDAYQRNGQLQKALDTYRQALSRM